MMNMRLVRPAVLVDLNRVAALGAVRGGPGRLRLGALVRQRALERDARIAAAAPLLAEAAPAHRAPPDAGARDRSAAASPTPIPPPSFPPARSPSTRSSTCGARGARAPAARPGLLPRPARHRARVGRAARGDRDARCRRGRARATAIAEVARRHGDFALVGACAVARARRRGGLPSRGARALRRRRRAATWRAPPRRSSASGPRRRASPRRVGPRAAELDPRADLHATVEYRRRVAAGLGAAGPRPGGRSRGGGVTTLHADPAHGQRRRAPGARHAAPAPRRPASRGLRPDRHPPRLRARRVRRLHRARGRRARPLLPPVRGPGGRLPRGNGRGPRGIGRGAPPSAGGLPGAPRAPVRLLHSRHSDDAGRLPAASTRRPPSRTSARSCPGTSAAAPATSTSCRPRSTRRRLSARRERHGEVRRRPVPSQGRPAAPDRARAATWATSSCPGCSTPRSCEARTPTPASCAWTPPARASTPAWWTS